MIGDNLNTDILIGKNAGVDSFLVMSGVTDDSIIKQELEKEDGVIPKYCWEKIDW